MGVVLLSDSDVRGCYSDTSRYGDKRIVAMSRLRHADKCDKEARMNAGGTPASQAISIASRRRRRRPTLHCCLTSVTTLAPGGQVEGGRAKREIRLNYLEPA